MVEALETVNAFLDLTDNRKDIKAALRLLTTDFIFVGPLMRTSGTDEYAAMLEKFIPAHVEARILKEFEAGDDACLLRDLVVRTPSGGTITLSLAEWYRLRGGKIAEQRIYYDPREFAHAFGFHALLEAQNAVQAGDGGATPARGKQP